MNLLRPLTLAVALATSMVASAQVAVIVNPANANSISDNDISRAFLGKLKTFADGQSIKAVNTKANSASRVEFEKLVLKKSPAQVKAYWSKRLFTGKGKPLQELASDQAVIDLVASTPNAIGYIDASSATSAVKVIKTL
ncbi:phosphate ABC transporter substrate-binding protein [Thalassotalea euphylliae]|uniref:Phosphate ABC transporter substrate-binding protein n=1 Tax=Thalassotalea euphylliae TaxID=1655234 RepID=A0A3E0TMS0_9GAMM|nr:substrate-binding domain-containing protein [Thalassotalea euphylliae]REL25442.1 phosphate ABC transporter substrate-binding protein [Thalassotalea euphylliae]